MLMKKKAALNSTLCRNFCPYYKPQKNEDLACQGYLAVQRLIAGGKRISLDKRDRLMSGTASEEALKQAMCRACSFYESDCDFILTGGESSPCGGFVLLSRLLAAGEITIDDIT